MHSLKHTYFISKHCEERIESKRIPKIQNHATTMITHTIAQSARKCLIFITIKLQNIYY